jgi:hypothetical protein
MGKRTIDAISIFLQTVESPLSDQLLRAIPEYLNPPIASGGDLPDPIIDEPKNLLRPRLSLAEPRPEEVARQISLVMHRLFSAVHPREFYSAIANRTLSLETPGLQELYQFGSRLKLLVAATLLCGQGDIEKDRVAMPKKMELMIEIARQLLEINNYDGVSWFISAFNMKCIRNLRLRSELSPKTQELLTALSAAYDWKRASAAYTGEIRRCYANNCPAVPNMRYELALVAADAYGGAEFEQGAINWGKRRRAADFIAVYHHFQKIPYRFHPIVQIQTMLERGSQRSKRELNQLSIQFETGPGRE